MSDHVKSYFCSIAEGVTSRFHRAIALDDLPKQSWEEWQMLCPKIPKGWYELCHLPVTDRIEFLGDYWRSTLPFQVAFTPYLERFFNSLQTITLYLVQKTEADSLHPLLIYALKNNAGFFQGNPPATEKELATLQQEFNEVVLPADYLAFLKMHNGFSKCSDTGLIESSLMKQTCNTFKTALLDHPHLHTCDGKRIEEPELIPFYQSYAFPCFQCFWAGWHPGEEMGNIYYSGLTHTVSNHLADILSPENQAFPTFLDWLMFYLETIEEV